MSKDGTETRTFPIVGLLPARNAVHDLDRYFSSLAGICDAVVALDDGSTDGTYEALAQKDLVKILLRNPVREDYRGWDDADNRNRLLTAAAELNPEWILSLDADERFDAVDADALRTFLDTDALPGCAYGFRHVPMRRDGETFWPQYQWIYRLFSYEPGQRFPPQRLHFVPIPATIPRHLWVRTTLRVQHLGGMTEKRRLVRFNKYLEADPTRKYQADYSNVLHGPPRHELRRWLARPAGMPVLLAEAASVEVGQTATSSSETRPVLSAIVISRNDEATIARTMASVVSQELPEAFEVILVTSGTDRTAEIVRGHFPAVRVVQLDHPALPGEARNAGLAIAEGAFVSFPGSHVELPPGSLAARLRAHRRGYAMVTGITSNGNLTTAGWASYFLDQHEGLPGHRTAELNGPPAHCSYARLPLIEVGGFPERVRTGEDTAVNRSLVRRGYVGLREPSVKLVHTSPCRSIPDLVRHHFNRGQGWGRLAVEDAGERGHMLDRDFICTRLIDEVPRRLTRIRENVAKADPELALEFDRVRLPVLLGAIASVAGMWLEILRPAPGKLALLFDRPVKTVFLISRDSSAPLVLASVDLRTGEAESTDLSPQLELPSALGELVTLAGIVDARDDDWTVQHVERRVGDAMHVPDLEVIIVGQQGLDRWQGSAGGVSAWRAGFHGVVMKSRGEIATTMPGWVAGGVLRALGRRG